MFLTVAALRADPPPVTLAGAKLAQALDAMDVEHLWLPHYRVNWETGRGAQPIGGPHTHHACSAFVAAACTRLGVPMLHPPEHVLKLLANAQYDWLPGPGAGAGLASYLRVCGSAGPREHRDVGGRRI